MNQPAVTLEQINDFFISHVPSCTEMNIRCNNFDYGTAVARFTYDDLWTRPGSMVAVAYAAADVFEEHDEARLIAHATASYVLPDGTELGR